MAEPILPKADPFPIVFSTDAFPSPLQAFEHFQSVVADICDVILPGDVNDFHLTSKSWHFGNAVMHESLSSALRYNRTEHHLGRGIDHFQLCFYFAGGAEFVIGETTVVQRPGDVALIDMARPSLTREIASGAGRTHVVTFMLPRALLAPLIGNMAALPTVGLMSGDTAYGRLVRDYMVAIWRDATALTSSESQSIILSLVHLALGGRGRGPEDGHPVGQLSQEALRARVKRHIEDNLGSALMTVDTLCRHFGLSRTGLYRLLAPLRPAAYIQQRRLHRAFAMMLSPAFRTWRIIDIALEFHFSTDAAFIRAFRRQFGITPGEVREQAGRQNPGAPISGQGPLPAPDIESVRWVAQLTGAMPERRP